MISLWQQPQNLIGWCMLKYHQLICKHKLEKITVSTSSGNITYYLVKHVNNCGVSLGDYIFLDRDRSISLNDVRHEYGHQLQSRKLGPLYLLLIGLPSIIGNLLHRYFKFNYYKQPWEKSADKLGDVHRF